MITDTDPQVKEAEVGPLPHGRDDREGRERTPRIEQVERTPEILPPDPLERQGRGRPWLWLLALAVVVLAVYLFVHSRKASAAGGPGSPAAAAAAAARPMPVLGATATTKDVGVYLTGLGTVTPLATVTVRSRVDGQLIKLGFSDGQLVRAGDLIAQLDPRPFEVQLMQAQGQAGKDEAALKNAQVDLQRYEVLAQEDSIPRQQLDTQVATVAQFEATLKSDQAQVASARLNLTYSRVTAPLSGRVGLRLVDPGNIVHVTDPNGIVVITQLQPIDVIFTIPSDQLPQVQRQLAAGAHLPVDAFDRDLKNKLSGGELQALDNQIDQTTGTVRIKAIFSNRDSALFPNQFVNARLLVDTLRGIVTVPAAAIQRSPQATFVWLVKPDKTVTTRNVEVAQTEGDEAAIRSGLAPGDVVVIDGVDKLRPGARVGVTMAAAARGAAGGQATPGRSKGPGGSAQGRGAARGGQAPQNDSAAAAGRGGRQRGAAS